MGPITETVDEAHVLVPDACMTWWQTCGLATETKHHKIWIVLGSNLSWTIHNVSTLINIHIFQMFFSRFHNSAVQGGSVLIKRAHFGFHYWYELLFWKTVYRIAWKENARAKCSGKASRLTSEIIIYFGCGGGGGIKPYEDTHSSQRLSWWQFQGRNVLSKVCN
jgi:hypothetical protein